MQSFIEVESSLETLIMNQESADHSTHFTGDHKTDAPDQSGRLLSKLD